MTTDELPNRERLDALFRADPYARVIGAELVDWGPGWAQVAYTPSAEHTNFAGYVHGGALFSAADAAFAFASNSWGRVCVALTMEAHYLSAPDVRAALVVEARERSRTRSAASYLIETRDHGSLVGSFHAMVYRTSRWHFGAAAWPDPWRAAH